MSSPAVLDGPTARLARRPSGRTPRGALVALGTAFVTGVLAAKALEWLALTRRRGR